MLTSTGNDGCLNVKADTVKPYTPNGRNTSEGKPKSINLLSLLPTKRLRTQMGANATSARCIRVSTVKSYLSPSLLLLVLLAFG